MSLTIREMLAMPAFERAVLVAGKQGIDHVIRWVHIVDMPDATYEWAKGGELLLTVGFGLREDPARQKQFIANLVERQLIGLVLSVGHYLKSTPAVMCEQADELNFPIIELPPEVAFIEITKTVFSRIINQQYALAQRAEAIHRTLTQLVLDGGTLQDVAEKLAHILERSITIESATFEVLASAKHGAVDIARTRSVQAGRTSPDVAQRLLDYHIYDKLLAKRCPQRIPIIPELGMTMERTVAPIIVARKIIGYVWIIAGDLPLNDLDTLAIERAANVAALIMFNQRAVRNAEMMLRGDFLTQLLNIRQAPDSRLIELAHQLGFNLNMVYRVLVVGGFVAAGEGQSSLAQRIEKWLADNVHPALVVQRGGRVVVVSQGRQEPPAEQVARDIIGVFSHPGERLLVGIGCIVQNIQDLRVSYEQASESLDIAFALGLQQGMMRFEELGILHLVRHLPKELLRDNIYIKAVNKLADYDARHQSDLVQTLETYLDVGNVVADAAAALYIHRNTLAYRLERIKEVTGLNLKDALCRLNLHVAIKHYRLYGKEL